jgi:hypothetical protein
MKITMHRGIQSREWMNGFNLGSVLTAVLAALVVFALVKWDQTRDCHLLYSLSHTAQDSARVVKLRGCKP